MTEKIMAAIKARRWKLELDEMFDGSYAAVIYGPLYYLGSPRPKYGFASSKASQDDAIAKAFEQADAYTASYEGVNAMV